ncbi:MAG: nitroreductase [Anaerolineae bacterium]|jgi:nitroreductase|nr:hypothetical protein [Chloroflexota bacterium]
MGDRETIDRIIRNRRSSRAFLPQPVPKQVIKELLEVARWAPSASNAQPWRVTVATGSVAEELRRRLGEAAEGQRMAPDQAAAYRQRIARGPMAFLLDHIQEPIDYFLPIRSMTFFDAPVALVLSFPGGEHAPAPAGVHAFATTLLLAAEARGVGAVWLRWPMGQREIIREVLAIPEDEQPSDFIALGYPDDSAPANQGRSPREEVSSFTRWLGWE